MILDYLKLGDLYGRLFIMDTNQQPTSKKSAPSLSLILKPREMTNNESIQYQCWLDKKTYEQDTKY
jgi:hypothetical protein